MSSTLASGIGNCLPCFLGIVIKPTFKYVEEKEVDRSPYVDVALDEEIVQTEPNPSLVVNASREPMPDLPMTDADAREEDSPTKGGQPTGCCLAPPSSRFSIRSPSSRFGLPSPKSHASPSSRFSLPSPSSRFMRHALTKKQNQLQYETLKEEVAGEKQEEVEKDAFAKGDYYARWSQGVNDCAAVGGA